MTEDPYKILGLRRSATEQEIKGAYRELAKKYHPDLNPGDAKAAKEFNRVSAAYSLLSDETQRARFDRGEIDLNGKPKGYSYQSAASGGKGFDPGSAEFADLSSLFASLFGKGQSNFSNTKRSNSTVEYTLNVDFLDAALGSKRRITAPNGKTIDLRIPEACETGQKLLLKGVGPKGENALLIVKVTPHQLFTRKKNNIHIELPVGFNECILGSKVKIPTIYGLVETKIPRGAQTGTTLKLKGKGVKGGDQYVKLKIMVPDEIDLELTDYLTKWTRKHAFNPRKDLKY